MNIKKYLFFIILSSVVLQNDAFSWKFFNNTSEAIVIKAKLIASSRDFFSVIKPSQSEIIKPEEQDKVMAGFCLSSIEYAQYIPETDLKDHVFIINTSIQLPLCHDAEFDITKENEKIVIKKHIKNKKDI